MSYSFYGIAVLGIRTVQQCVCMEPVFSILIPTWNNLPYLKLCVESIRKNSTYRHQIIVHVNEGTDGTLDWVQSEGLDYTHSEQNVGVCLAMNMMRSKVKTDYIVFFNDDMYACPHWDEALLSEIKKLPDNMFLFASTVLQRHGHAYSIPIRANYGSSLEDFREEALLKEYTTYEAPDRMGAIAPPNIVHRDVWDLVGGYSVEFSPGFDSDPDFVFKLYFCGVREVRTLSASRVYHFERKSTGRVRYNSGAAQFSLKWGITPSTFCKLTYTLSSIYEPALVGKFDHGLETRLRLVYSRLKILWIALTHDVGPLRRFWKNGVGF